MATTNFNNQKFIRIIRKEIKDISVILNNLSTEGFFLYSYIKNQVFYKNLHIFSPQILYYADFMVK